CAERADRAAEQDRADVDAGAQLAEPEGLLQAGLGAVDDTAVVPEHEAADGRHRDNGGDEGDVDPRRCGRPHHAGRGWRVACRGHGWSLSWRDWLAVSSAAGGLGASLRSRLSDSAVMSRNSA